MQNLILFAVLVTLPLLLGGCDRLSMIGKEPVAEAKPELEGVNEEELEARDGIAYLKGTETPYTGKQIGWHENGKKEAEINWRNGILHGLFESWYDNGTNRAKGNWKEKKKEGLWVYWYESGQRKQEGTFKDGKQNGLVKEWFENGQISQEGNWKDDKKNGSIVFWYENGQKEEEGTYIMDKTDGLYITWHKNGQKMTESNYRNGNKIEGSEKFWNSKGDPVDSLDEAKAK